jgi:hypothetical protein
LKGAGENRRRRKSKIFEERLSFKKNVTFFPKEKMERFFLISKALLLKKNVTFFVFQNPKGFDKQSFLKKAKMEKKRFFLKECRTIQKPKVVKKNVPFKNLCFITA